MPLRQDIKKVLVIGSGPIVIGQAAEFDYAGTQACRALKEDGIEVVLINSNPATIMTDKAMADRIYIEPLNTDVIKRIIEIEKPDSVLSTLGGQTGLTLSMRLAKEGVLEKHGVKLLGASCDTIDKAEDRQLFKETMASIGQPTICSEVVETVEDALRFAETIGYPVIVRPAFTLGGSGGGIAENAEELTEIAENGLRTSPITQILIERSVSGWKEIEYEVVRDAQGNCITVCSMENFDPVGVHTGDSIVVAPALTLADKEYQMLRDAAIQIVNALKVEGGCNCQFALNPDSFEYYVIEVNPRVSRSSALASKATGYPIARVATKIAVGYALDEILNSVTGKTYACFEPALDYVVVKFPRWPFDKFVYGVRKLGTQMKATGEAMAIGTTFEEALMKAVRSIELGIDTLNLPKHANLDLEATRALLRNCDDERAFAVYRALKLGISADEIFGSTKIDRWYLHCLGKLAEMEKKLASGRINTATYLYAKRMGFTDAAITRLSGSCPAHRTAGFKMVDTCAGEFKAETPYFYSSYGDENEAAEFIEEKKDAKKRVLILGSGPIRIGQGIEFDYCTVHCIRTLKGAGYDTVVINNNPETVSTDPDTGDRLYFEPLTPEDVAAVIETEHPIGAMVQFGGQTAIKLAKYLARTEIPILGTSAAGIDMAEDRKLSDEMLERCGIDRPRGLTVKTAEEAVKAADTLEYPVLLRPSYVLGGQNMIIAKKDADVLEYMNIILRANVGNIVLIDKYLEGIEVEVDAICDGEDILIPGVMEHIERAGIHSGDSVSVYPAQRLSAEQKEVILSHTYKIAKELRAVGLINIQYVIYQSKVYVIEVNPRSSRTVPYISKVTGVPMVALAVKVMLGEKLKSLGYGTGLYPEGKYTAVKVPVFSFEKLSGVDTLLGPEMKSTGEVLGIGGSFHMAAFKGLMAAGYRFIPHTGVLLSVKDDDKEALLPLAKKLLSLGHTLYATKGTAEALLKHGVGSEATGKLDDPRPNLYDLFKNKKIGYVVSTADKGRTPELQSVRFRRMAVEHGVTCFTSLDTANLFADCAASQIKTEDLELVDITKIY